MSEKITNFKQKEKMISIFSLLMMNILPNFIKIPLGI